MPSPLYNEPWWTQMTNSLSLVFPDLREMRNYNYQLKISLNFDFIICSIALYIIIILINWNFAFDLPKFSLHFL